MATQQAYQAYAQNKGTLVPGQSISVNKFNVQIERYLSQGGFAHVYLVRTAIPVYNTTHHVLKRIAVANDGMLTEVKKEVDIMRILKGHPNIVHFIDAAWHRMPNGQYEVFILMEFCPGGGIIDMMNRRLRERLTEAEILQIFVDVCEGVAAMHNMRPALLHRDLKVENILQSSPTSFKLCDFGSATPVASRPPATTQEIRALEADLNRHTTLQYRAPEMVDPFLRRPVDDKSDVWALGVLLYKLCYYTTPFEEHGPLAILNVQYRTPPYPVYSAQMNSLIGAMLQEHGAQRPSVFELLSLVHGLRGTKSPFKYNIPTPQPLSPRHIQSPSQVPSQVKYSPTPPSSPMVPLRSPNAGIQAREKVLDAINPMRRGRPALSKEPISTSRPSSPQKQKSASKEDEPLNWLDGDFDVEEDKAWKAVTSTQDGGGARRGRRDDAWNVGGVERGGERAKKHLDGFENDFAEKLPATTSHSNSPKSTTRLTMPTGANSSRSTTTSSGRPASLLPRSKDAFEGLGLGAGEKNSLPTLGEARKFRTGLAAISTPANGYKVQTNSSTSSNSSASRLPPSPRSPYIQSPPSYIPQTQSIPVPQTQSRPPASPSDSITASSVRPPGRTPAERPRQTSSMFLDGLSVETRFPSLEELDSSFGSRVSVMPDPYASSPPKAPALPARNKINGSDIGSLRPVAHPQGSYNHGGVRSEQVTGVAMRAEVQSKRAPVAVESKPAETPLRPTLARKHRSTISIKHSSQSNVNDIDNPTSNSQLALPVPSNPRGREPEDWLTGDNDATLLPAASLSTSPGNPILRDAPSKRASFIEKSTIVLQAAQEATPQHGDVFSSSTRSHISPSPSPPRATTTTVLNESQVSPRHTSIPGQSSEGLPGTWSPMATASKEIDREKDLSSSADEGPEDVTGYTPPGPKAPQRAHESVTNRRRGKGRQSSVHDLVDLYGGGLGSGTEKEKELIRTTGVRNVRAGNDANAKTVQGQSTNTDASRSLEIPRSTSPQAMLSPSPDVRHNTRPPKRATADSGKHRKQSYSAKPATSPVSSHSRPQSMFIFPTSKATSESTALSPSRLSAVASPSEEPKPRPHIRRTSISDMVQHYEAIGGKTKIQRSPTAVSKPASAKVATHVTDTGRYTRGHLPISSARHTTGSSLPVSDGDPKKHTLYPNGLPHASPKPPHASPKPPHSSPKPPTRIAATNLPRAALAGYRDSGRILEAHSTKATSDEQSASEPSANLVFPTSSTSEPVKSNDDRPPSPERPYQGVGRLIDQWQRKTVENDMMRGPGGGNRRGRFAVKGADAARGR